ncbi:MAG: MFS transporter [Gemmatimonadetes bacterium]|nr:MFS transporter [Gemmatimonadota bacterium]
MTPAYTPEARYARRAIALATFLTLVPLTLVVAGLNELVIVHLGGSRADAHAFTAINMATGIVAVPIVMVLFRRWPNLRAWLVGSLLINAVAFLGMNAAPSVTVLLIWRAIDGVAHLPAVTLLMVAANRLGGERRGATLGLVATALMAGVAVGSPLGGWLVERGVEVVYYSGAALLALAALASLAIPPLPAGQAAVTRHRYEWKRTSLAVWMPLVFGFIDRFTVGVFVSTFTLYLSEVQKVSPSERGLLMALFLVPFAVLCWPVGRLADRVGWFWPIIGGTVAFGVVYSTYGLVPHGALPWAMLLSGVTSALMFAPNLLLVSEFARHGSGEGLFGAFQVAGSFGFLTGPIAGGIAVEITRRGSGVPDYDAIFIGVGTTVVVIGLFAGAVLAPVARAWHEGR